MKYKKLTYDSNKVQVESAIRDGEGVKISTNYQKKPKVIEYTVPNTVTSNQRYVIATDDNYDGSPRYIRMRFECVSSTYTQNAVIEMGWAKNTSSCSYANILGMTTQYSDIQYIGIDVPNSSSYNTTYPPQIWVYNSTASEKRIKITILDSNCDLTWKTAWDTVRSTTNRSTYENAVASGYKSNVPYASYATTASSATVSTYANFQRDYFRIGQSDTYRIMAVADDGIAYCVNDTAKKFTLPIKMYVGVGRSANTTSSGYTYSYYNQGYTSLSYLSSSSYNNLTVPTWTASDGDKTLYLRGSLDNGKFVCDGNVTLSMDSGYTYIPFGKIAPNYSGTTAQIPTYYTFNAVNIDAYTLDEFGKLTHINGVPVPTGGGVQLLNTTLTFSLVTDTTDPFYDPAYPYRAALTDSTITSDTYATVTLSGEQATSGYYSPICRTDTGVLYLYANTDVGQQTIPTINLGGGDTTTSTIDSAPTSGSGNAVSSNGVYTNCVRTVDAQTIAGSKTFTSSLWVSGSTEMSYNITNTSITRGTTPSSTTRTGSFRFTGTNNATLGEVYHVYGSDGSSQVVINAVRNASSRADLNLILIQNSDGTGYATAPYRTYHSANTTDIVTIGHLNSNITLNGTKTYTNMVYYSSEVSGDGARGYVRKTSDSSNDFLRIGTESQTSGYDYSEIRVCMNRNNGVAAVYLAKVINGAFSQTKISNMESVDINNYPAAIQKTGIGTKLASCKYCILYWHDSRLPSIHTTTMFPGQSGGTSAGISPATYELTQGGGVFFIGVYIQNTSADRIDVTAKFARISDSQWGDYLGYMVFEKIEFYY